MNNTQTLSPNKIAQVVADLQHITTKLNEIMEIMSEPSVPTIEEQIGLNFLEWAEQFFAPDTGRLDRFVPSYYALEEYRMSSGVKTITPNGFNGKMRLFAQYKNLVLNPETLQNDNGRVIKNYSELKYDHQRKAWTRSVQGKAQSMIYLQTPGIDISNRVFDPIQLRETGCSEKEDLPRPYQEA